MVSRKMRPCTAGAWSSSSSSWMRFGEGVGGGESGGGGDSGANLNSVTRLYLTEPKRASRSTVDVDAGATGAGAASVGAVDAKRALAAT
jgi:hypothetical protein